MTTVGDSLTMTVSPVDDAGNPADVAGLAVRVVLPDGSIAGPFTPSHDGVGSYSYPYVTTQVGRHVIEWSGTGWASSDVANVWPADPRFLFSLAQAKHALRWKNRAASDDDDLLRLYIASATEVIEDIVGPVVPRAVDEWIDGGSPQIILGTPNVLEVLTVGESWGSTNYRSLTSSPLDSGTSAGAYTFTFDPPSTLTRRTSGAAAPFPAGRRNVHVTYRVGMTTIKPNLILAAQEEFRFLWQLGQQGNRPGFGSAPEAAEETPSGYAVPRRVIELCGGAGRYLPGIA